MSVLTALTRMVTRNLVSLGMSLSPQIMISSNAKISDGRDGVIYIEDEYIEAVGFCAAGKGKNPNEDSLGVFKRDDGKYLFHLADGMGGQDNGKDASRLAIEAMQYFLGTLKFPFNKALHRTVNWMEAHDLKAKAGSTYSGLLLGAALASDIELANVGDSQITVSEKGQESFTTTPQNFSYFFAQGLADLYFSNGNPNVWFKGNSMKMSEFLNLDENNKIKHLLEEVLPKRDEEERTEIATLLFRYIFRDHRIGSFLNRNEIPDVIESRVLEQKDNQLIFLYTDGVGDLFTPFDIIKSFQSEEKPLYEEAFDFVISIMKAQEGGRQIDLGVRPRVRVDPKHDNYAFWVIRRKAGESSRVKGEREEQNGDQ